MARDISPTFLIVIGLVFLVVASAGLLIYRRRSAHREEGEPYGWGQNPATPVRAWPFLALGMIILIIGLFRAWRT